MTQSPVTKSDIRAILWEVACLGTELASIDDDRLDDAELGLDSLTAVWLIVQFERRTGCSLPTELSLSSSFRTVNTMHSVLADLGSPHRWPAPRTADKLNESLAPATLALEVPTEIRNSADAVAAPSHRHPGGQRRLPEVGDHPFQSPR